MTGIVRNLPQVLAGLDIQIEKVKALHVAAFRRAVWEVFQNILENTPQFTGQAAASWNIGIDAPDYTIDAGVGDDQHLTKSANLSHAGARQRGDRYWIEYARIKNKQRLFLIKAGTKVFITNAALGDTDHGKSSERYMESLQDATYWMDKLRAVNKPYETAAETVALYRHTALTIGELDPFL